MVVPTLAVLIVAGDHVPVIVGVFVELAGKAGAALFWHSGAIAVNVGVMLLVILTIIVVVAAH